MVARASSMTDAQDQPSDTLAFNLEAHCPVGAYTSPRLASDTESRRGV